MDDVMESVRILITISLLLYLESDFAGSLTTVAVFSCYLTSFRLTHFGTMSHFYTP